MGTVAVLLWICTCLTVVSGQTDLTSAEWLSFKTAHNKTYSSHQEEVKRHAIWQKNMAFIKRHNAEAEKGEHSYWVAMNHFGDLTVEEVVTGFLTSGRWHRAGTTLGAHGDARDLPTQVDWRARGFVTPVQNQGQCGSCWAFAALGALEAQHKMATGDLTLLSAQNLMDCSQKQGNWGCSGGLMDNSFEYIKVNKGVDTDKAYPYEAKDGKCRFTRAGVGATLRSYVDVEKGSELALQKAVAEVGPVAIGMDAQHDGFIYYKSGVYSDPACSSTNLNHALLVTGYGTLNGVEYWDNKNSFGEQWGDKGYIKIARNKNNMCGVANQASYPVV